MPATIFAALLALHVPEGHTFAGRVVTSTGAPAADVRVVAGEVGHATVNYTTPQSMFVTTPGIDGAEAKRWAAELRTDANGAFTAPSLAPGEYGVIAATADALVVTRVRLGGGAGPIELALAPASSAKVVIRKAGFDPQRHVLELRSAQAFDNVLFFPELERKNGWSFDASALPPGLDWRIVGTESVPAQDYRATLFDLPVRMPAGKTFTIDLTLDAGQPVHGFVAGPQGKPFANVSVVARSRGTPARELGAVTDASGAFVIRGLNDGTWDLIARRWTLRELAGCGNGRQDLEARAELVMPRSDEAPIVLALDDFLAVPKIGAAAPEFRVKTITGADVSLADLRGKVVLLDFWATWCGMCRMEFPKLQGVYDTFAKDGRFEIVGVSVDTDVELVRRFVASRELRWPQTALGIASENEIARLFNVNSTPSTVLIDKDGKIAALDLVGPPLHAKIAELLRGK